MLARAMPDYHKKLIMARVVGGEGGRRVEEIRWGTFHRMFKKRKGEEGVGGQVKKKRKEGGEKEGINTDGVT